MSPKQDKCIGSILHRGPKTTKSAPKNDLISPSDSTSHQISTEIPKSATRRTLVLQVFEEIAANKEAKHADRVAAARSLGEALGIIGRQQQAPADAGEGLLRESSPQELEAEHARLRAKLSL